jgi:hypothetical protein
MEIPVVVDGFKSRAISLRPRGVFSFGPKLRLDGKRVQRRGFSYMIPDDSGREVEFRFKHRFWDPVPDLIVAGQRVELLPPLKTYEHLWICLPIFTLTLGGLVGGACGAVALGNNYKVFRRVQNPFLKYILTGLITLCAPLLYFTICLVLDHGFGFRRKS